MALIGYWNFKDAPLQNTVVDSAGSMDITHGGGGGAGWWRDDPDYAIFGNTNQWRFLANIADIPDITGLSEVSWSFAVKMLAADPIRQYFRLYAAGSPFSGWGVSIGTNSFGTGTSDGEVRIWNASGSWEAFPSTFSTAAANDRFHSVVLNMENGGDAEVFIDGVSLGTVSLQAFSQATGSGTVQWGTNYSYTDNIQYHDRVLTADEIAAHAVLPRQWQDGDTLPDGLGDEWGWWCPSLDDSANDISGNANNGTYVGGLSTTADTGAGGTRAYDIDAFTKGVQLDQDILLGETAYSYSCWFKPDSDDTGGSDRRILGAYSGGNVNANLLLSQNNGFLRMLAISDSGTTYVKPFTASLSVGQWHHLCVVVYDGSAGYYAGFLDGIPFTFYQYLGAGKDTGRTGLEFNIGGGTNSGFNKGAPGLIDDARLYKRALSDAEVEHISLQRGQEDRPTFTRVNIRKSLNYITDTDKFSACQPNSTSGQPPYTWEYNSSQKYGWIGQSIGNFRDRSSSVAPQLAGMSYTSSSGIQFRIDLPRGAGTYRIGSVSYDALSSQGTGWDVHDGGTSGSLVTQITGFSSPSKYVDVTGASPNASAFDFANENYIEHTFTSDHVTWTRNTSLGGGNGVLSSAWVELVDEPPPPPGGFYDPFTSKTFNPNYTRRIG
jgi:hypothetical protein